MRPLISADLWRWIEDHRASFEPPVGNKAIWEDSQFTAVTSAGLNHRRELHTTPLHETSATCLLRAMTLDNITRGHRRTPSSVRASRSSCPPTRRTRRIGPPTPGAS